MISVVIPARNERFLTPTIRDLLANAQGEIEVIAVLEAYWPDEIINDPRVHYIHNGVPLGMRNAINAGVAVAKGEFLMKCDAHCAFAPGYDLALTKYLEHNWIAVPTRYSLDPETWQRRDKTPINHMYLCAPTDPNDFGGPSLHGKEWHARDADAQFENVPFHDLMSAQGSCWIMHRSYFHELELEDAENYGDFCFEFQEIGLKCWLSGGRVVRNRTTWYAHLHKGRKYGRGWPLRTETLDKGAAYTNGWMKGKLWHKQNRDIRWLVDKFKPVPTWSDESVRLVFHRRHGGSGEIRGTQIAQYLLARVNPPAGWSYDFDVHVWVKQEPANMSLPGRHYLDVLDEHRRIPWLLKHPECGVIASSQSGLKCLQKALDRGDVVLIPQHHCNYERVVRTITDIKVAGVIGGAGALQCNVEELRARLAEIGVELRIVNAYEARRDVVEFYKGLDVQIVWRNEQRVLKNPLKLINAMSFGIPTIAHPEVAYEEVSDYYWGANSIDDVLLHIRHLRNEGFDAGHLVEKAEEYHIEHVARLYGQLL
jgi:glycosyltransferase involved in cell wall biosynthesis